MNIVLLGVSIFLLFQAISGSSNNYVEEVFKWKKVEFEYSTDLDNTYVGPYRYHIPENENIVSMGYHPASGLIVVSFLRTRPGIPTTLGAFCASEYAFGSSPVIWRFPNPYVNELRSSDFEYYIDNEGRKHFNPLLKYRKNQWEDTLHSKYEKDFYNGSQVPLKLEDEYSSEIQRIVSVFQLTMDEKCNRLFFVDNGRITYNKSITYAIQKPALVVVGLPITACHIRNFPIVRRVEFPDKIADKGPDGYTFVTLDYQSSDSCDGLYLYIPNIFYNFITVYDYKKNEFWTFDHETFNPVLAESFFIFDKTLKYEAPLGILNIALGYPDENGDKLAYYTKVSGTAQYAVSTKVLKDKSKSDVNYNSKDFKIKGYLGCNHQTLKTVIDYTYGVMFYSEFQSNQIRCWNMSKPLNPDNIGVVYESDDLKIGSQLFIDSLGYLWFHSSYLSLVYFSDLPLNLDEFTTKMFRMKVSDVLKGTICYDERYIL
ncbi:L-dopachrome tautomerase yellow-f2-like [Lutzomyia longipalpis]|uniref:L-dopachrome tautomerase yellow-f2-like n=1 Tax=Lutzomyia longipalpis TaxID=7200 RepID=UPI002483ED75|nr:L-dopachrome tautomerase yellow-f2-like [Lutzomyia longipalpis]